MSDFKTSLDEYTDEEKKLNGNMMYGGKRHDEICDYLQSVYKFNESQINDVSMGIWMAIESERRVKSVDSMALAEKVAFLQGQVLQLDEKKRELDHVIMNQDERIKELEKEAANLRLDIIDYKNFYDKILGVVAEFK